MRSPCIACGSILFINLTEVFMWWELFGDSGICIVDSEPGEIVVEVEMKWDGNPNIVLDIKTHVGVGLPIQVWTTWSLLNYAYNWTSEVFGHGCLLCYSKLPRLSIKKTSWPGLNACFLGMSYYYDVLFLHICSGEGCRIYRTLQDNLQTSHRWVSLFWSYILFFTRKGAPLIFLNFIPDNMMTFPWLGALCPFDILTFGKKEQEA